MAENKQGIFKLNFNFVLTDAEGFPIETIKAGIKAGSATNAGIYEDLVANRLLGRTISLSNEDLDGTAYDWYSYLLKGQALELSKGDTKRLRDFILNQKKDKNPSFNNVVVHQLLSVFEKAGYKED